MDPLCSTDIPSDYANLAEAFSKAKATQLPTHQSSDCAIELLPGTTTSKGRIFKLSQPETESVRTYIEEELAKGFIVPSKYPASAEFFFVKKREGTIWPCMDYRGLNDITAKFQYPCIWSLQLSNSFVQPNISLSSTYATLTIWFASERGMSGRRLSPPHLGTTSTRLCHSGLPTVPQSFKHS